MTTIEAPIATEEHVAEFHDAQAILRSALDQLWHDSIALSVREVYDSFAYKMLIGAKAAVARRYQQLTEVQR